MYQHGKKSRRKSNPRTFLSGVIILGIALIVVAWVLHKDLSTSTTEKTTVPIVTEVSEDKKDVKVINEPQFTLELPADWEQVNRVQSDTANFYEWRATKKGIDDRRLILHINVMPGSYKITRMQPVMTDGSKLILGNLSSDCVSFAGGAGIRPRTQGAEPFEAKWEDVIFTCDPVTANQTIGTGTPDGTIGTSFGSNKFFFYYEDHNIRPDDKIIQNAIRSFRAKQ